MQMHSKFPFTAPIIGEKSNQNQSFILFECATLFRSSIMTVLDLQSLKLMTMNDISDEAVKLKWKIIISMEIRLNWWN